MLCALIPFVLGTVVFTLEAPDAKAVALAGDVTGWSRPKPMVQRDGRWTVSFELPDDARTEYKFVVDGEWILDPKNPKRGPNGLGGENSVWEGPAYRHRAKDAEPAVPLKPVRFPIDCKALPDREVAVWLPPAPTGRLPVLIYADGKEYESLARAPQIVANLIAEGAIRPVALVLVPPSDRTKEYWRDSGPYSRFVVDELLPEIRRRFPVSSDPREVFLGGASLGGLVSLRTAAEFPEAVQGGVHSQSGAFQVAKLEGRWALDRLAKGLRVFLDWGTMEPEIRDANKALLPKLKDQGLSMGSLETHEGHNYTAWRERLEAGLRFLLGRSR